MRRRVLSLSLALSLPLCLLLLASGVIAQTAPANSPATGAAAAWPSKAIRILVGFPGGSSPDLTARTLAEPLSKALGQPVIVENRVGASGNIAADLVAKATDDHTLGLLINGNMTIAKLLNPALPYDPLKDLAPVSLVGTAPLVLTVPGDMPGATAREFFAAARSKGNTWSYGSPGVGTVAHIGMELLKGNSGIDPVHVPYPGNPQIVNAMIGGQIQLALLPPGLAMPQVRAGKLKAVGLTSSGRSALVPDVASLDEQGVTRNFRLEVWNGIAAPATMSAAHLSRLSAVVGEIVRSTEVRQKLVQQGWDVAGTSAEGLANRIKSDTAQMGSVITARGIKVE